MMSNDLNWNGKLEAVHLDGRVVPATLEESPSFPGNPDKDGDYWIKNLDGEGYGPRSCFNSGGTSLGPWTIRNVATPAADEFGPEIKVDGKRPEWINNADWDIVWARCTDGTIQAPGEDTNEDMDDWEWKDIEVIRLPADHPHYRTHSPATPPLSLSTGDDRLERYEGFLRRLADLATYEDPAALIMEARGLVAEMPELPDPDLVKAREIGVNLGGLPKRDTMEGLYDTHSAVECAFAGVRAGRELGW